MGEIVFERRVATGQRLAVVLGDLTEERVAAIVNAANEHLHHGGGVAGAIVRRGGAVIQDESDRVGFVPTGQAAATTGGALPARRVIHAVGPRMGEGDEDAKLESAVRAALAIAEAEGLESVSLPAISSGIFGFPKDRCARILVDVALEHFAARPDGAVREVRFCNFDRPTVDHFLRAAEERFGAMDLQGDPAPVGR